MKYFVKSDYKGYTTIYERASYTEVVMFAAKLRSKHRVKTFVYTDKVI